MPLLARSPHRCFRAVHSVVVSLVLCSVALHEVSATYEAWLGATPRFTYADREPASTMTVVWADGVSWPATVPRHVRQPNMFTPEQRAVLVDLFRGVVREAEIALMDYAGLEHQPPWDDGPRFDDALRPLLVLTVELFAGEEPPVRGRLTLPADGFWHRREAQREDRRRGPRRL